ncbi:histidine triad nucleotide-binding protein [Atopobium sp. oral taxon 199]|uniref:histidine triad nucleotide-binding protein n=1 Tax=Atopobium sp. oral taxon 199 TaxID=712156 RepID=UPI00034E03C9|nr:histidine triad nucleotide-binding protein [Atopobium sp. oral taxon 199]EPD77960.1 hit-like protein [Atopobium sp. oral taxon 199 str. F0494]
MSDCIFCKLANGEIPTEFLYEDEHVVAFRDASPLAPVHVLVVPKAHHRDILDNVPAQTLASVAEAIKTVVDTTGIRDSGFRVITNTGKEGGQSVMHLHFHILGGRPLNATFGEEEL